MRTGFSPVAWSLGALITLYQWTIRPVIGPHCRFHPSCSDYAKQAIARHGALRGSLLGAGRILRCNPWNEGGEDPVPCRCRPLFPPLRRAPARESRP
jgi:putative membrane protein insertion efficiency factor